MFAPRGWLARRVQRKMYRLFQLSELFDEKWYRSRLSGFARYSDPIWHYISVGASRGLAPSQSFDAEYYEDKNEDVRQAKLNPLFHYLEYGSSERRMRLKSGPETLQYYSPESADMRFFLTPSLGNKRVSVLLDSLTVSSVGLAIDEIISFAAQLAQSHKATLRILHRTIAVSSEDLERGLRGMSEGILNSLELTAVPCTLNYSDVPFFDEEISLATSWTSARALRFVSQSELNWMLVSANSSEPSPSHEVGIPMPSKPPGDLMLTSNSNDQREYQRSIRLEEPKKLPHNILSKIVRGSSTHQQWRLGFISQAQTYPEIFCLGVESINHWLSVGTQDKKQVTITFLGETSRPMAFLGEIEPTTVYGEPGEDSSVSLDCVIILSDNPLVEAERLLDAGISVISMTTTESHAGPRDHVSGAQHLVAAAKPSEISHAISVLHAHFLHQGSGGVDGF